MTQYLSDTNTLSAELRKFLVPEFLFGIGALERVGQYAKHLGARNLLVVTDPGVLAAGWTQKVLDSLTASGIRFAVFSDVKPNPSVEDVMAGAERYRAVVADALLSVGGGSVIDCAKGIGIVVADGGHIRDFEGIDRVVSPMPPMLCVPTTGGTGSDISQFAIITDCQERRKLVIASKAVVPDLSLVDPTCLITMDAFLTACTGLDTLAHAIEALVSTGHSPFTDQHALEAIRLVNQHLLPSIARPNSLDARSGMASASLQAGMAFSNASLGLTHAMAHALGGLLNLPHGQCVALLMEHVVGFNFQAAPERHRRIALQMGLAVEGVSDRAVCFALQEALRDLRHRAGVTEALASVGVDARDIPKLAENALRDICIVTNPRPLKYQDVKNLYALAL